MITKVVIYITMDIPVHNVPGALKDSTLPALCTGKPITAGVVAFWPRVGRDRKGDVGY